MTEQQIKAKAQLVFTLEHEIDALEAEQRALFDASLATDVNSPETMKWSNRGSQINDQISRLKDLIIKTLDGLSDEDTVIYQRAIRTLLQQA